MIVHGLPPALKKGSPHASYRRDAHSMGQAKFIDKEAPS